MIVSYQIDIDDQIAYDFAIGAGMETVDPVTGESIEYDVQQFLNEWLKGQASQFIKSKGMEVFSKQAKLKAKEEFKAREEYIKQEMDIILG